MNRKSSLILKLLLPCMLLIFTACPSPTSSDNNTINEFSIIFDKNNDQATGTMGQLKYVEGDNVELPANSFSLDGYNFTGWSTSPTGSLEYSDGADYTVGNSDITMYAQWEKIKHFRTKWQVSTNGEGKNLLYFPIDISGTYDFAIWWGDGCTQNITNSDIIYDVAILHEYDDNGIYEVKVQGTCDGFGFQKNYDSMEELGLLIDVLEWGEVTLHNKGYQFYKSSRLENFSANDKLDVSNVTNMRFMFSDATLFNGDISYWDVGNVTDMNSMFAYCELFNIDISNWNVGNVTDMNSMFAYCEVFNIDISNWNVGSVQNMEDMFYGASTFNQDLSEWDVSNVTNMCGMFTNASAFNQDISMWDVGNVLDMTMMFRDASAFNKDISAWGSKVAEDISHTGFSSGNCPLVTANHPYLSWD